MLARSAGACAIRTAWRQQRRVRAVPAVSGVSRGLRSLSTQSAIITNEPDDLAACNEAYDGILEVRGTPDKGWGLFATKAFGTGDRVMSSRAVSVRERRGSHTIQKDWNEHIAMDLPAVLINHSCDANVGIKDNELGAYDFHALGSIAVGEELLWDYEAAEYELSVQFQCQCGSPKCRGLIGGFKVNGDMIKERYGEYYASYLK